jgi:hypothetical protein
VISTGMICDTFSALGFARQRCTSNTSDTCWAMTQSPSRKDMPMRSSRYCGTRLPYSTVSLKPKLVQKLVHPPFCSFRALR